MIRRPAGLFEDLPDYPFAPHFLEWNDLRIHYVDEGDGPPVVLFHGEPTWSFLYRKVIPHLTAAGYRAIAPDMPGFGKSDAPTDPDFYTYEHLVDSMVHLVDSLDLRGATAVVQDWGGPVGLRTAVTRPDRFERLVIMNTALYSGPRKPNAAFDAWRSFVEQTPDLPIGAVMGAAAVTEWPPGAFAGYEAPFPTQEHKVGAWRLPLIVPRQDDDPGAAAMAATASALGAWTKPALVLFSDQDPMFSLRAGERWATSVPGAGPLEVVEGAGHFLQEDAPDTVGKAIVDFLRRTDD